MKAFDTLRIYVMALRKGSLSAAGKGLGLSAATVSRRITALEDELGVQLLDRMSRTLKATEAGHTFLAHAERLLEAVSTAEEATRSLPALPEGKLRVHARTMIGMRLIAPMVRDFCARHPGITVDLILSDEAVNIVEHHFDIDIRTGRFGESSFALRRFVSVEDVIVASPDYLQRSPPLTQPQDLLQHNCMTYRKSEEPTHWRYRVDGEVHELAIQGNFHSNSGEVLRLNAVAGMGLALLAEPNVAGNLADGSLVRVLPQWRFTNSTFDNGIFAVFRAGVPLPHKVRLFIDFLVQAFEAQEQRRLQAVAAPIVSAG